MSRAGRAAYRLWFQPLASIRETFRHGGPFAVRFTEHQRKEMQAAAARLIPLRRPADSACAGTLHVLTGKRFWWQTAFCLHSFARHVEQPVAAEIYDDGSLDDEAKEHLSALGLRLQIHSGTKLRDKLEQELPLHRFPVLRERWTHYPHIRKIIDVHLGSESPKLVLDSDLLFYRKPDYLLQWMGAPLRPLHAVDCQESYGYDRTLLQSLVSAPLPARVNVGLCGLNGAEIDWDQLEFWSARLIATAGTSYYLEQALVALLVAGRPCAIAPECDYITLPESAEIESPTAVMHHFVDTSKRGYFRTAWRGFLSPSPFDLP